MDIYSKNLDALAQVDRDLEKILRMTTSNEIFEVFLAENADIDSANITDKRDSTYVYEESSSIEIQSKLKEFEKYDNYPILYFFGIGNGSFFKELLKNEKHQEIMLIEPEIELLYIALNLIDFSEEILSRRFVIKLSVLVEKKFFVYEFQAMKKFFVKAYNLHVYSHFYDKYRVEIDRVNKEIIEAFKYSMYIVGNSAKDSLIGLEYSLKNIPTMITTPPLRELTKEAKNTKTAVIVSTGPSLSKQLKLLKEIQEYITILCIDASLPILAKEGIKPDIVFSIERVPLTGKFYKDTPKEFHKDIIFSLATVCHDETINNIYGEKSFFMRADSYNVFMGLDEWGYMGGGQSSANFAYDFAAKSQYDNIIFIGQDLSYAKDGRSHSQNHVFGENEVKSEHVVGEIEAYGGEGKVVTTKIWKAFLNSFVTQVSVSNILSINSTEGGARINGTVEMSFKDAVDKYLNTELKKKKIILEKPSQASIEKNLVLFKTKVNEAISIGLSMQKKAEKLYKKIDTFLNSLNEDKYLQSVKDIPMKTLNSLIDEIGEIKEKYNDKAFTSIYGTLLLAYVINHEYEVANVYVMRENSDEAHRLKKVEWLKVHHEWLYRVYINVEEIIKLFEESQEKLALSPKL